MPALRPAVGGQQKCADEPCPPPLKLQVTEDGDVFMQPLS